MIEMSHTNLHFACVVPPIMAPNDDSRPHLKKVLVHRFYALGQIQAKVVAYEKLIMMPKRMFWIYFLPLSETPREINTMPSLPRVCFLLFINMVIH